MKRSYILLLPLGFLALLVALAAPMPVQAQIGTYALATANGSYLTAFDGGGGIINVVHTDATVIGSRETFNLVPQGGGEYVLRTVNGHYLTAVDGGGRTTDAVHTDATAVGPWEKFTFVPQGDGEYALQTSNGHYLTAVDGGGRITNAVRTDATAVGPWERFTVVLVPQGPLPGLHPWTGVAKPGFTSLDTPTIAKLNRLRADIRKWAILCNGSVYGERSDYTCPGNEAEKEGDQGCYTIVNTTGDANLYNGLMCLSGEESFCRTVKRAQGSDGRWWRSPDHVDRDCRKVKISFSGDMEIGTLAYLVKTRDTDAAKRWWHYIEYNNGLLCPDDLTVNHDMCGIMAYYPVLWPFAWVLSTENFGLFRDVWEGIGLTADPLMSSYSVDSDKNRAGHACSIGSNPTWKVYNLAGQYLIKQFLDKETALDRVGVQCLRRLMPDDPYIAFLAEGASAQAADLTLKTCSRGTDDNGNPLPWPDPDSDYHQWMTYTDGNHWSESEGWDCVFLVNLLIGPEPKLNLVLQLKPAADKGLFQIVLDGSPFGDPVGGYSTHINLSAGLHTVALRSSGSTDKNDYITQIGGDCARDGFVTLHPAEEKYCVVVVRNKNAPAILTVRTELIPHNDPGRFDVNVDGVVRLSQAGDRASTGPMRMSLGDHAVTLTASAGTDISRYETDICSSDGRVRLLPGDEITCMIRNTLIKEPNPVELCLRECQEEYKSCLAMVGTPGALAKAQCGKVLRDSTALCRKAE